MSAMQHLPGASQTCGEYGDRIGHPAQILPCRDAERSYTGCINSAQICCLLTKRPGCPFFVDKERKSEPLTPQHRARYMARKLA